MLYPRCRSLRHLNQNEIRAAENKLIKEGIGVPSKYEECTEEDNGSKRKPSRVLTSLMLHRKQFHRQHQQRIIQKLRWRNIIALPDVCDMSYLGSFAIKVAPDVIPMDWWKVHRHQFPCIAQLPRKLMCVTATSTLSKRVFSDCGLALTASVQG